MMENLFYTPLDLAWILLDEDLTVREEHEVLNQFWQNERIFIAPEYRNNKGFFFRDVYVLKDYERGKRPTRLKRDAYINYYFKYLRYRLVYGNIGFIKCQLRTLLSIFVYGTEKSSLSITRKIKIFSIFEAEKRSPSIIRNIENYLFFYHLSFSLSKKDETKLCDCKLEDFIVIRQGGK